MSFKFTTDSYNSADARCVYNADRLTDQQVEQLLADDGALLYAHTESISDKSSARSYMIRYGMATYFLKEYLPGSMLKRAMRCIRPAPHNNFKAAANLLRSSVPTPTPILAAALTGTKGRRSILLTEFCDEAMHLDKLIKAAANGRRGQILEEVAALLADFHSKGFHAKDLCAHNILVAEQDGTRTYWFIDLDCLCSKRFLTSSVFVNSVISVAADFFPLLNKDERGSFLRYCFHAALKQNIYKRPSDEPVFTRRASSRIDRCLPA